MIVIEWIKFIIGSIFVFTGIVIFFIEMIGVFKFKYVLNRMHAAAMGDTLGIASVLIGLMIFSGFRYETLKMLCIILFLWFSSPTASHLIARLEVTTDENKEKHFASYRMDRKHKLVKKD